MASSIDPDSLSALMQAAYASLASAGDSGTPVTTEQMCDALASAIATEVNNTIVASYFAHTHPYVDGQGDPNVPVPSTTSATLTP